MLRFAPGKNVPQKTAGRIDALRRFIHENLASLRFSVNLRFYIYYNNLSKKAKPRFCLFPPICRKAYGKKVNVRDFIIGKPLNIAHGGKKRRLVGRFFP